MVLRPPASRLTRQARWRCDRPTSGWPTCCLRRARVPAAERVRTTTKEGGPLTEPAPCYPWSVLSPGRGAHFSCLSRDPPQRRSVWAMRFAVPRRGRRAQLNSDRRRLGSATAPPRPAWPRSGTKPVIRSSQQGARMSIIAWIVIGLMLSGALGLLLAWGR